MTIIQITPGAGRMYCGNCFRDNALVAELRRRGHSTLMVPLYLPLTLDEPDQSHATPVFFSGVNVYLDQQFPWFRKRAPAWLRRSLSSARLLRWVAGRAAKTRAADVGELTLSMLGGEAGRQARDLEELTDWLRGQPRPDVVCLSNAMLMGMARKIREVLRAPIVCMLQGEDTFLDELLPSFRERAWSILRERSRDLDWFIAPSHFFAGVMERRLGIPAEKLSVVPNGISLEGYPTVDSDTGEMKTPTWKVGVSEPPVVGYFARMCRDKGLDLLVDAFIELRRRNRAGAVRLRVGGGCGPTDALLVRELDDRLARAGLAGAVEWVRNPDRSAKVAFLESLTVFSVPARCGEAFGLYVVEAMAAGVPVVLPRSGSFPELVGQSGGGVLCEPEDVGSLANALEGLLLDNGRRRQLSHAGQSAVHRYYGVEQMAESVLAVYGEVQGAVSVAS